MRYFVYLIISTDKSRITTYVGYTSNIAHRIKLHNSSKGAKSTRGYKWKLIYKKKFLSKSRAMSYEYKLKNNRKLRLSIIKGFSV